MSRNRTAVISWRDNYRAVFGPLADTTADAWLIFIRANARTSSHADPVKLLDQAMASLCDNWSPSHMNEKPGVRDLLRAYNEAAGGGESGRDPLIRVADGCRATTRRLSDLQGELRRAPADQRFDLICAPYRPQDVDLLRAYCRENGLRFVEFVPPKPFFRLVEGVSEMWKSPVQPEMAGI